MSCVEIIFKSTRVCLLQELICDHATVRDTHVLSINRSYVTHGAVTNRNLTATAVLSA